MKMMLAVNRRRLLLLMALLMSVWDRVWTQNCAGFIECGQCIGRAGCAWCFAEGFPNARCQPVGNFSASCPPNARADPRSSFGGEERAPSGSPINVTEVRLNLRVGDPQTFQISVTPQRNLPLDLYILIDVSQSMLDELRTVQNISTDIARSIENITTNVRLGIGAFNEKITHPFSAEPLIPSLGVETVFMGIAAFSFRHIVTLTNDTALFSRVIRDLEQSTNADFPENGLEALAQVIACEEVIGWRPRPNSVGTRLVLFMTDQEYHYAGEGRLAGILTPYNTDCLLEQISSTSYEYLKSNDFDYPSVGRIAELLRQNDVTTIFAIQQDHISSYETFVREILNVGSVRAATQSFLINSTNADARGQILGLIETEYRRLLQQVSLDISGRHSNINLEVRASCPANNSGNDVSACDSVPLETQVNFTVTATLNSCENLMDQQTINTVINSPSFGSFNLAVTVVCNCECARQEAIRGDGICSGSGVIRCAVCECDDGKCGSNCDQIVGNRTNLDCPRGGDDNLRCSGRGTCDCVCFCNENDLEPGQTIFGDACQCDNFRCPDTGRNGEVEVCSGMDRGLCCDGTCMCLNSSRGNPYRGLPGNNNCQCEPVEEVCIDPKNGTLCNNRGTCGCQFCICNDPMFGGIFCDIPIDDSCLAEADMSCLGECRDGFLENELPDVCTEECAVSRPILFIDVADIEAAGSSTVLQEQFIEQTANQRLGQSAGSLGAFRIRRTCQYPTSSLCVIDYYLLTNETHFAIIAERREVCSGTESLLAIPIWALALIIIGALIVLGFLLLVLIKIIFLILDYIEVKRWEKDAQTADFSKNTNPLYQSPEMKYENVAYGRE